MPQITSDGFAPYITSIGAAFGPSVDYAQTVKNYRVGSQRGPDHRYEPPREPFITKTAVYGTPDMGRASTAYVERQNATARHTNNRIRRLNYGFSKKPEHHRAAVALNYVAYNLCHVVRTLRVSPAVQAGITDHVWTVDELLDALLSEPVGKAPEAKPLTHREPEAPARPLPNGRGFLRLVTEPTPAPKRAPVVPAAPTPPAEVPHHPEQLPLFPEPPTDD
jgi:hypothetical protein